MRKLATIVLTSVAILAASPFTAGAANTVIGFDDLAPGTVVKDQYQGQGLRLSRTVAGDADQTHTIKAASPGPGNVLELDGSCVEFCSGFLLSGRLEFGAQHIHVTVTAPKIVGGPGTAFEGPPTLRALNAQGNEIAKATMPVDTPVPFALDVSSPNQVIQFFEIGGVQAIDDLTYDTPATPQAPDFTITPLYDQFDSADAVHVLVGESTTVPILLNRFNGSSGPINFDASVTSGFVNDVDIAPLPTAFNGPDGSVVKLKATVDKASLSGSNQIKVTAQPGSAAAGSTTRSFVFKLVKIRNYDLAVNGIEVTQGVQTCRISCTFPSTLPDRDPLNPSAPVKYSGVPLVAGKTTVVRVYANQADWSALEPVENVGMQLEGFDAVGNTLPQSPLLADNGNNALTSGLPFVNYADRAAPNGSYNFTLPPDWFKKGTIRLRASVLPPTELFGNLVPGECTTSTCKVNNTFELTGVTFTPTSYITVTPVALLDLTNPLGWATRETPDQAISQARNVVPLRDGGLTYDHSFYQGIVIVTPPKTLPVPPSDPAKSAIQTLNKAIIRANDSNMADALDDWNDDHLRGDLLVGVFDVQGFGLSRGKVTEGDNPLAVVAANKPFNSVAHEIFHGLGRVHASKACGGGVEPQVGEDWPPDQQGELQSVGFDVRANTPVADASDPTRFKDFMSYCLKGVEANAWISARGWSQTFADIFVFNSLNGRLLEVPAAPAAPGGPVLRVRAYLDQGTSEASILSVTPRDAGAPAAESSPFTLVAKGAAGNVLASTPMNVVPNHVDGEPSSLFLKADVPAAGVTSVEVVSNGQTIATRARSNNAPQVKVLAPSTGATVGRRRRTTVRWSATDADGDKLRVKIDYSIDDGRTWNSLAVGPLQNRLGLPSALLAGSPRARVRVRANDGFNETAARSGRFTAVGRPPSVAILQPQPRARAFNDAALYLSGQAFDDRFREITSGGRLTWMDGQRIIGHGRAVSVSGLAPGLRTLRLVARDDLGRRGSKSVRVRLLAARPRFLRLDVPRRASSRARSVTLRVASTLPGSLRVGRLGFAVRRTARAIRIPVARGRTAISLNLRLTAYRRTSTRTVQIARG